MPAVPKGKKPRRIKPKRLQDKAHLAFVAQLPCVVCGMLGVQLHHLIGNYGKDGPVRGWGLRAGDNFVLPMCELHHRRLHADGNEKHFLGEYGIDGLEAARKVWGFSKNGG